jgi:hypothetical protein
VHSPGALGLHGGVAADAGMAVPQLPRVTNQGPQTTEQSSAPVAAASVDVITAVMQGVNSTQNTVPAESQPPTATTADGERLTITAAEVVMAEGAPVNDSDALGSHSNFAAEAAMAAPQLPWGVDQRPQAATAVQRQQWHA